jgi:hypothetical protein
MKNTLLRSLSWALALLVVTFSAHAQLQLAASTGSVSWAARVRGGSGRMVSGLCRVYLPPSTSTGSLAVQITDSTSGGVHQFSVSSAGALNVQGCATSALDRATDFTNTYTEGRFVWFGFNIPTNFIGGGAVNAALFIDVNGTWTAATVSATETDPTGTIGDTSGAITVSNGTNAAVLVGPVYLWAGAAAPDTAAEFQSVANGTVTPGSFTDLVFATTLRDDTTDTVGGVTASSSTGATFATQNGLPSWSGVRHHRLIDIDPSRETSIGVLTSIANRALTGAAFTAPTAMVGGEIVDTPYGNRVAYLGEDRGTNTNRAWEAPANGPLLHTQYCTTVAVLGVQSGPGSTAWNILATDTDLKVQILGLGRFGYNGTITDTLHRVTSTPAVYATTTTSSGVAHWHGTWGKHTNVTTLASATTGTIRLGALTTSTTPNARIWLSRLLVFEGTLSDAEVAELITSLGLHHGCRHYVPGVSRLIGSEGQSSLAGTWDDHARAGALHRIAGLAPRTTIVFPSATGGQSFTNHNSERDASVSYFAATLCPAAKRKTFLAQVGSNDLDAAVTGATLLGTLDSYLNGNASTGGTVGNAISALYDRIVLLEIAPRYVSGTTQASYATEVAVYNAGMRSIANVDRVIPSLFTNHGAGGDWFNNPTYYHETEITGGANQNGVHLNPTGHDLYWRTVWRQHALQEMVLPSGRSNRSRRRLVPGRRPCRRSSPRSRSSSRD